MITHQEPDILECKVKGLKKHATNKTRRHDEIPAELFQILNAVKVLHSISQQIWKTQQWPQDWKRSVFIPIPRKSNAKQCSNYHIIALISHTSNVMLRILQARLQQCSCLESPRDGGAWSAAISGVAQSRTRLKRFSSSLYLECSSAAA